jgi:metal-responsive CopG/Arc/MetJ family transcriptional regulator
MKTVQIVLDSALLRATDGAARRTHVNRSALVREALREHLKRLQIRALEERDRAAYEKYPDNPAEVEDWARKSVWPEL